MRSVSILRLTIALTCVVSIYQAVLVYLGIQTTDEFEKLWGFAFVGLLAFWVDTDSRGRLEIYRPSFDIGFFMFLMWIFYLPYYLVRTRGRRGWLWLFGLILLAYMGTLMQWVVYAAS